MLKATLATIQDTTQHFDSEFVDQQFFRHSLHSSISYFYETKHYLHSQQSFRTFNNHNLVHFISNKVFFEILK